MNAFNELAGCEKRRVLSQQKEQLSQAELMAEIAFDHEERGEWSQAASVLRRAAFLVKDLPLGKALRKQAFTAQQKAN